MSASARTSTAAAASTAGPDASETPQRHAELVRRGYSAEEIGKIWSGNLLRVWREVERVAQRSRD